MMGGYQSPMGYGASVKEFNPPLMTKKLDTEIGNPHYIQRMKLLNDTLNKVDSKEGGDTIIMVKSGNTRTGDYNKNPVSKSSFVSSLISFNDTPDKQKELMQKQKNEFTVSKAIYEYNQKKNRNIFYNE